LDNTGPLKTSNCLLDDAAALRARLAGEGYLFFEGLIDGKPIRALYEDILRILDRHHWLDRAYPTADARSRAVPAMEGEPEYFAVYDEVQKLERFHGLAHETSVMAAMRQAVGQTAFPHPLGIARLSFPDNDECTTPPHQDYPNNQGTEALYAAWIPLRDCPRQLGGIAILEGSHKLGLLPLKFSLGAGGRQAVLPPEADAMRWLSTDFKAGDLLVFGSLTVHRALPNRSRNQFRLSVDFRYQEEGRPLTPRVLEPHFGRLRWERIYAGWDSNELQYYWKTKQFTVTEWNEALQELPARHMPEAVKQSRAYNERRGAMRTRREGH